MSDKLSIANKVWEWGKRTYIMGILNVTPDSFSDGGRFFDIDAASEHVAQMVDEGAHIIDVGGEATRPGFAVPISAEEEVERVIPVIQRLSKEIDLPISVDTYKAKTAELAVKAGAHMINDIWGLKKDPEMADAAASCKVPICIMHNRTNTEYDNLMEDILFELGESIELAIKAGIKDENIILDPGIGFGKTWEQNLTVMRNLEMLKKLGYPILLGASRKNFIGKTLGLEVHERLEGTLAVISIGIMKGVDIVRVHDVLQNARTAVITDRIVR
ncbi:dihydropteroate synthase [Iocasia frigidifontis]|uniref:Dihydropteroate synthase n=1 Tax=Iocasia fonsfrigidae TaxID=2682810 RepID=A0A8A7KCC4_9FIRM|nr:dihydropteroate synthase [Iocasia fonsfrigidae]QTL97735.1 dihydropteroate synthase [Iocasia fonsfrigidae]